MSTNNVNCALLILRNRYDATNRQRPYGAIGLHTVQLPFGGWLH